MTQRASGIATRLSQIQGLSWARLATKISTTIAIAPNTSFADNDHEPRIRQRKVLFPCSKSSLTVRSLRRDQKGANTSMSYEVQPLSVFEVQPCWSSLVKIR